MRNLTFVFVFAFALAIQGALAGLPVAVATFETHQSAKAEQPPEPTVLVVDAAPEPTPALQYSLLPALPRMKPGNAALFYSRGLHHLDLDNPHNLPDPPEKTWRDKLNEWSDLAPDELPEGEARQLLDIANTALDEFNMGALREDCDWQLPIRERGFGALLGPIGEYRTVARLLSLKARLHIRRGEFHQAVFTLQTGFALARNLSKGDTLIENLVGTAIAALHAKDIEYLIQQPGAPNLYWALSQLPHPFINMRKSLAFELHIIELSHPMVERIRKGDLTREEWLALPDIFAKEMLALHYPIGMAQKDQIRALLALQAMRIYPRAKRDLIAKGVPEAEVEAMPVPQVVATQMLHEYLAWRDGIFKWFTLPYWQAAEGAARSERAFQEAGADAANPFLMLLPAIGSARKVTARQERGLAMLRTIEALRGYAAMHDGRLPESLDQLIDMPAPIDPCTGKPFLYEHRDGRATLRAADAPRMDPVRHAASFIIEIRRPSTQGDDK